MEEKHEHEEQEQQSKKNQPAPDSNPTPVSPQPSSSSGIDPKIAGVLCYFFGFISGLIFYLIEKEDKTVRFHALQSIFLAIAMVILFILLGIGLTIIGFLPGIGFLVRILTPLVFLALDIGFVVLWILLMVRAYQGEKWKLPVIGDMAERNA
jgi:uncharacterized membrane protein